MKKIILLVTAFLLLTGCQNSGATTEPTTGTSSPPQLDQEDRRILYTPELTPQNILTSHPDYKDPKYAVGNALFGCGEKAIVSESNAPATYNDREYGISLKIPYNKMWGTKNIKLTPYDGGPDTSISFGPLVGMVEGGCSWFRLYNLSFSPATSLEEAKKKLLSTYPAVANITVLEVNGLQAIKAFPSEFCGYPTVIVIGKKFNYDFTTTCGEEKDFKMLFDSVRSIKLLE